MQIINVTPKLRLPKWNSQLNQRPTHIKNWALYPHTMSQINKAKQLLKDGKFKELAELIRKASTQDKERIENAIYN